MGDEYNLLGGSANRKSAACLETHFSNINEESSSILSENGILVLSRYILQALPHEQGTSAPSCFGGFNFTVKMPDHLPSIIFFGSIQFNARLSTEDDKNIC